MKRNVTFFLLLISIAMAAQQIPGYTQYQFNNFILNPAIAGTTEYIPLSISNRMQWNGFKDAPSVQTGSLHGAISPKIGLGIALMNAKTGPNSFASAQLAYAYHLKLAEKVTLSFGLAPMLIQYSLAKSSLTLDQPSDNTFARAGSKNMIVDLNAGIYLHCDSAYYISFSAPQIFENKLRISDDFSTDRLKRHLLLNAGCIMAVNDRYALEPSVLVKAAEALPLQADLNLKAWYRHMAWLGISYRSSTSTWSSNEALAFMIGVRKPTFDFGYSYDYNFTSLRFYSLGSHEIFFSYKILRKKKAEVKNPAQ